MFNSQLPSQDELPTSRQLLRSTLVAFFVATVLLFITVLPAEYGIDPTGIGEMIGLKAMGEIKTSLEEEANADNTAATVELAASEIAKTESDANEVIATMNDVTTRTLAPGDAIEIKIEMVEATVVQYSWIATDGKLNYNLHGDGYKGTHKSIAYKKGAMVAKDAGELTAAFDGYHGWFWRNREEVPVTVSLQTTGNYIQVKQMK